MLIQKIARVALLLGLVLNCGILSVSAVPMLNIAPSSLVVQPGQSFSLDVRVTDVTDLYAFQFDLGFNPAVLSALSTAESPFLPSGGTTAFIPGTIDNTAGAITFTADTLIGAIPGVSGSGTLATIDFQALALGTSPVTLFNVLLLDSNLGDITASTTDGSVTVVPEPSTWLLLATGCIGLVGYGWYRRRQRTA